MLVGFGNCGIFASRIEINSIVHTFIIKKCGTLKTAKFKMKTQNSKTVETVENLVAGKNSNYKYFLETYKTSKIADSKDLESHKVVVRNFLNAHNREFKEIAPIKNWLSILNSEKFIPRKTSSGKFSLFFTLQALNKELKKGNK